MVYKPVNIVREKTQRHLQTHRKAVYSRGTIAMGVGASVGGQGLHGKVRVYRQEAGQDSGWKITKRKQQGEGGLLADLT